MTAWPNERAAIENMMDNFGSGVYSIVMDSYDYAAALSEVGPWLRGEGKEEPGVSSLESSELLDTFPIRCLRVDEPDAPPCLLASAPAGAPYCRLQEDRQGRLPCAAA